MLNLDENRGKKNRDKIQKVQQRSLNKLTELAMILNKFIKSVFILLRRA